MKLAFAATAGVAVIVACAGPLIAAPDRLHFPKDFDTKYVLFNGVYNGMNKRVRLLYVNPEADAAAKSGQPAPNGTILVMVDKAAKLDANGNPMLDEKGQYVVEGPFLGNLFVMEKQAGWGSTLGIPVVRNGDWDYATFNTAGVLTPNQNTAGCFECHARKADVDFTFNYVTNLQDRAK